MPPVDEVTVRVEVPVPPEDKPALIGESDAVKPA